MLLLSRNSLDFVILTLSAAEGEGSVVRREKQVLRFAQDDNL